MMMNDDGKLVVTNCEYCSGSFADCLPKYRRHADSQLSIDVTPRVITVRVDGRAWLVFKRAKGERYYSNDYEGLLLASPTGATWGSPIILGA